MLSSSTLADLILYAHFLYVLAVLIPIPLIIIGAIRQWRFIRNRWFRRIHAGLILFVLFETAIGMVCPLTEWEAALRVKDGSVDAYAEGFISGWVSRLLFYDLDPIVFALMYLFIASVIVVLYVLISPRK